MTKSTKAAGGVATKKSKRGASAPAIARAKGSVLASIPFADPADRQRRIELAAYFFAEQRGFAPGGEESDWAAAVRLVDGT